MILTDIQTFLGGCAALMSGEAAMMTSFLLMGLVGSITHCTGMCGPIIIAQTGQMQRLRDLALIPYHLGRITTYVMLAVILSLFVNIMAMVVPMRMFVAAPLLFRAGCLFLVNAFPALQKLFPFLVRFGLPIPKWFIEKLYARASGKFITGMILGLMPCGMVMAAMMAASTAPTMGATAINMGAFGVGTVPALIIAAVAGRQLQQKFPTKMQTVKSGLMVWSGLWLFTMAGFAVWSV